MLWETHGDVEESVSCSRTLEQDKPLMAMGTWIDQHMSCGLGCAGYFVQQKSLLYFCVSFSCWFCCFCWNYGLCWLAPLLHCKLHHFKCQPSFARDVSRFFLCMSHKIFKSHAFLKPKKKNQISNWVLLVSEWGNLLNTQSTTLKQWQTSKSWL